MNQDDVLRVLLDSKESMTVDMITEAMFGHKDPDRKMHKIAIQKKMYSLAKWSLIERTGSLDHSLLWSLTDRGRSYGQSMHESGPSGTCPSGDRSPQEIDHT